MNLWNARNLEPPPHSTCRLVNTPDLKQLFSIFQEAAATLSNQKHLHAEAAMLSRTIYRMKMKFRSDRGLKEMQKVNSALLRYLQVDFLKTIQDFLGLLPEESKSGGVYYPTRNLLDFILVRAQGVARLMCRIVDCARQAALYLEKRISIGHVWKVAAISLGIVARVFVLAKNLARFCCKFYNELIEKRGLLKNVGAEWSGDYVFPAKLEEWLDNDLILLEDDVEIIPETLVTSKSLVRFCDDSDVEFCDETVELDIDRDLEILEEYVDVDAEKLVKTKQGGNQKTKGVESFEEDIGEKIVQISKQDVESLKEDIGEKIVKITKQNNIEVVKQKKAKRKLDDKETMRIIAKHKKLMEQKDLGVKIDAKQINSLNSLEQLSNFMKLQAKLQKKNSSEFKFRNLNKMQWNMLNNLVKNHIESAKKSKKKSKITKLIQKAKEALIMNIE